MKGGKEFRIIAKVLIVTDSFYLQSNCVVVHCFSRLHVLDALVLSHSPCLVCDLSNEWMLY